MDRYRGIVNRQSRLIGDAASTLGVVNDLITSDFLYARHDHEHDVSHNPLVEDPDDCLVDSTAMSTPSSQERVLVSCIDEIAHRELAPADEQHVKEDEDNADKNETNVDESGEDVGEEEACVGDMRGDVPNKPSVRPRLTENKPESEQEKGTAEHYRNKVSVK